jgi:hypothetical protein
MYERLLAADGLTLGQVAGLIDWTEVRAVLDVAFPDVTAARAALRAMPKACHPRKRPREALTGKRWTPAEERLLRGEYPGGDTRELARRLNRSRRCLWVRARLLGLSKNAAALRRIGLNPAFRAAGVSHRFQKGHVPWSKGTHFKAGGRSAETRFRKGESLNRMPIGSTRWIGDGHSDRRYLYRKVSDVPLVPYTVNWKAEHHLRWERYRGPVPEGYALVFRNGDRSDVRIANLELITRRELMRRNTIHRLPPELVEVIRLRGALVRQIRRRSNDA